MLRSWSPINQISSLAQSFILDCHTFKCWFSQSGVEQHPGGEGDGEEKGGGGRHTSTLYITEVWLSECLCVLCPDGLAECPSWTTSLVKCQLFWRQFLSLTFKEHVVENEELTTELNTNTC